MSYYWNWIFHQIWHTLYRLTLVALYMARGFAGLRARDRVLLVLFRVRPHLAKGFCFVAPDRRFGLVLLSTAVSVRPLMCARVLYLQSHHLSRDLG